MTVIKRFDTNANDWVAIAVGQKGEKGDPGDPGGGLPTGGTEFQLLEKASATDGDARWTDVATVKGLQLDIADPASPAAGRIVWNDGDQVPQFESNGKTVNLSLETLARCRNVTGSLIPKGTAVCIVGASANRISIAPSDRTQPGSACRTLGLTTADIPNNTSGKVSTFGLVKGLNTNSFDEGDELFVGATPGSLTTTPPDAPARRLVVGYVVTKNPSQGQIFVTLRRGVRVSEIDDVQITDIQNGDVIQYNSTNSRFENVQFGSSALSSSVISDDEDTGEVTTDHTRTVISSLNSTSSGAASAVMASFGGTADEFGSAVIASVDSDASNFATAVIASVESEVVGGVSAIMAALESAAEGNRSSVIAASGSIASGDSSIVFSSDASEASGESSSVISSNNAEASGEGSIVMSSSFSEATALGTCVTSSINAINEEAGSLAMGVEFVGSPSTANRKIHLFSVTGDVDIAGSLTQSATFTDFAELMPNATGSEIPAGTILTLDNGAVRPANEGEDICGVVSHTAAILAGDTPFCWQGRYLHDEWGRRIYEEIPNPLWQPSEGQSEEDRPNVTVLKQNPEWNPELPQIRRVDRPDEWTPVGLIGQVFVRTGESVEPGDKISANNGKGYKSTEKTGIKVMSVTKDYDGDYGIARCLISIQV